MDSPVNLRMHDAGPGPSRAPFAIALASFTSSFDRFAVSPLLVFLAEDLGATLAQAVAVAGVYFLAYGFTQPVWGMLSDRHGRLRVMRLALLGAGLAGVGSALAPGLGALILWRGLTGAFFGGIIPTSITFIGDTVPNHHRQSALADNMAAVAVGTALATATAGVVGGALGWRVMFALPVLLAAGCLLALRSVAEPERPAAQGLWRSLARTVSNGWMLAIIALAFVEGAVVLGLLTLLAPALQDQGLDAATAGLSVAAYGAATLVASRLVRPLARRWPAHRLIALGGLGMVAGYAAVALHVSIGTVVFAAAGLGWTWALMHTALQSWATVVLPQLRGTAVSLFAAALFAGSSVGALLAGPLADAGRWTLLFGVTAVVAGVVAVLSFAARRAYHRRRP
ncbi:MFS transporter [Citricoccus sp. I39-566]|uniref:MFS transporter n=1 Tax=Citricoccus sp. I39-566 TaxID=3073268 RepID=UPI00286A18F7|nr:MFS transporter [Citricoccus sp. I39-566]WMY79025.1 MFS transporter [Citricoccus sp. I39-566]